MRQEDPVVSFVPALVDSAQGTLSVQLHPFQQVVGQWDRDKTGHAQDQLGWVYSVPVASCTRL